MGRFDQTQFTAYYLGVLAVRLLTSNWMAWQMSMEIRDGTLSASCCARSTRCTPTPPSTSSAIPMRILVVSPIVAVLFATSWDRLARPRSGAGCSCWLASLVGAWLLTFFSMVLLGTLAFYVDSAMGVFELWLGVHAIFSGYLIPLEVLPGWVRAPATCCRSASCSAFPVETLVGPADARRRRCASWRRSGCTSAVTGVAARCASGARASAASRRSEADDGGARVRPLGFVARYARPAAASRCGMSTLAAMQYRVDFLVRGLIAFLWSALTLIPLLVVFGVRKQVAGWTFAEALVVVGWFTLLRAVLEGAVSPSLTAVVEHVRKGTLDFVLLKPADAQFLVSTAKFEPWRVVDVVGRAGAVRLRVREAGPLAVAAAGRCRPGASSRWRC